MHRRLLSLWLTGVLLLPMCWGDQDYVQNYDDDITPTPDYDYTATFEYTYYSNASAEVDYGLYATIGEQDKKAADQPDNLNKASGIGSRLSPALLLGLAAQQTMTLL